MSMISLLNRVERAVLAMAIAAALLVPLSVAAPANAATCTGTLHAATTTKDAMYGWFLSAGTYTLKGQ